MEVCGSWLVCSILISPGMFLVGLVCADLCLNSVSVSVCFVWTVDVCFRWAFLAFDYSYLVCSYLRLFCRCEGDDSGRGGECLAVDYNAHFVCLVLLELNCSLASPQIRNPLLNNNWT